MKTNYKVRTRLKGMDSNVMQFVILDSLGLFTLGIKRHQENGPVRDFLHYTQEFYKCSISLKQNFTNIWFDNLYLSAKFARAAYAHEQKI